MRVSIDRPFPKRTVERKLHSEGFNKRSVKKTTRILEVNIKKDLDTAQGIYIKM